MSQASLFPVYRVHCFWLACGHTVEDTDPVSAHDRMEDHYRQAHGREMQEMMY